MTAPVHPAPPSVPEDAEPGAGRPERQTLRAIRVPTPQPPLVDDGAPLRLVLPGVPVPRPPHRPGPRLRTAGSRAPDHDFGPAWCTRADLPDPRQAGQRLLTLAVEGLAGRRPLGQLQPLTSLGVFAGLTSGRRPRWCTEGNAPLIVGPVRVCEPVDGVAEVTAVVRRAGRAHAVAARLEGIDGRWRCTALQIG